MGFTPRNLLPAVSFGPTFYIGSGCARDVEARGKAGTAGSYKKSGFEKKPLLWEESVE